jgi:hypothetical protein
VSDEHSRTAHLHPPAHWQAIAAVLALGWIFGLVASQLSLHLGVGIAAVLVTVLLAGVVARRRRLMRLGRGLMLMVASLATASLAGGVVLTVGLLVGAHWVLAAPATASPAALLGSAGLIWLSNVLVFALWYYEIDAGGPAVRQQGSYDSRDLVFPQRQLDPPSQLWAPQFVDYLFLAFNSSTALSPTDTLFLSRRMKLLMMCQALISLTVLAVVASRAVNALAGPT